MQNTETPKNDKKDFEKHIGKPVKPPGLEVPFDDRPHISLEEYIMTKETARIAYRFPEKDVARSGPAMALVLVNRDLEEAQNNLHNVRRFAAKQKQKVLKKIQQIQEIDLKVRHNALRYNQLVIENKDKKERSAKMIEEQKKNQEKLLFEIGEHKDKIKYYEGVIASLKDNIEKYIIYEDFLKKVTLLRDTRYQTPMDILNHYDSIMMCRDNIYEEQLSDIKQLNETIDQARKLETDMAPEIVKQNVIIHDLRKAYEKAKLTTGYWESKIETIKEIIYTSDVELRQIQGACWQMYCFLKKHRGEKVKLSKENTHDQLVYIKRGIKELELIVEEAKRLTQLEEMSGRATVGSDVSSEIVKAKC